MNYHLLHWLQEGRLSTRSGIVVAGELLQLVLTNEPLVGGFDCRDPSLPWDEFIEAIFGQQPSDRPPRTEAHLDRFGSFGYDQPVVITWCPSEAELHQVTVPVLIIEGDQSPAVLRTICHLLDGHLGNSRLIIREGLDHFAPWSAPDVLAQTTVEFIDRVAASEP